VSEDSYDDLVKRRARRERYQQALDRAYELAAELARLDGRLERLAMPATATMAKEAAKCIGHVIRELNARMELVIDEGGS
jgi:hypothetical protein